MIKSRIQIKLAFVAMATLVPITAFPQASESTIEAASSVAEISVNNPQLSSGENNTNSGFSKNSDFQTLPNVATNLEVEIQTRFNNIRSELLDERASYIDLWLTVIGLFLGLFAVVVAIVGFVGYKKFREIEAEGKASVKRVTEVVNTAEHRLQKAEHLLQEAEHLNQEIHHIREKATAKFSEMDASFPDANPEKVTQTIANGQDNQEESPIKKAIADAVSLQQKGKYKNAIKKWRAIAQIMEESDRDLAARAWFSIGFLSPFENVTKKISSYDQAIQLNPNYTIAYFNRGNAKRRLKRPKDAITDYNKAIQLKPDFAKAYNNRGISKSNLGRSKNAITDYNKAIQLDPESVKAYTNRGISKSDLGQHENAIADFDKAIQLDPESTRAYYNRGISKSDLGQHENAIADFDEVIELNPEDTDAHENRAIAKMKLGLNVEAKSDLETALELAQDSNNVDLVNKLDQILHNLSATNGD